MQNQILSRSHLRRLTPVSVRTAPPAGDVPAGRSIIAGPSQFGDFTRANLLARNLISPSYQRALNRFSAARVPSAQASVCIENKSFGRFNSRVKPTISTTLQAGDTLVAALSLRM